MSDSPPPPHGHLPPRRVGPYLLEEQLGAGGMGTVFRGRHGSTGAVHAVKLLRATGLDGANAERLLARFRREVEVLARVDAHPNVVRVHSAGLHAGAPWIAMELVEGEPLDRRLRRERLSPRPAARLVAAIARALHFIHGHGVVHRDLKPENILIDAAGQPRVTDFGLAYDAFDETLTRTGELLGTPVYMPPEQVARDRDVDALAPSADVYGLGAILYACLTARPPLPGEGFEILHAVVHRTPAPPSEHAPAVPPELDALCLQALAKSPADRPPTALAFAEALERWAAQWSGTSGSSALRALGRVRRVVAERPLERLLIPVILLAAVAVGALAYRGGAAEPVDSPGDRVAAWEAALATDGAPDRSAVAALADDPAVAVDPALARRVALIGLVARASAGEDVQDDLAALADDLDDAARRSLRARALRSFHAVGALEAVLSSIESPLELHGGDPRLRIDLARAIARGEVAAPARADLLEALARAPDLDDGDRARLVIASGEAALAEGPDGFDRALDAFARAFREHGVRADADAWPDAFVARVDDAVFEALDPDARDDIDDRDWALVELACRAHRGARLPPALATRALIDASLQRLAHAGTSIAPRDAARMLLAARWGREVSDGTDWGSALPAEVVEDAIARELEKPAETRRPDLLLLLALMRFGVAGDDAPVPSTAEAAVDAAIAVLEPVEDERWFHVTLARIHEWLGREASSIESARRAVALDRALPDARRWPSTITRLIDRLGREPKTALARAELIAEGLRVQAAVLEMLGEEDPTRRTSDTLERRNRLGQHLTRLAERVIEDRHPCCSGGVDLGELIDRCVALGTRYDLELRFQRAAHLARHARPDEALERSAPLIEEMLAGYRAGASDAESFDDIRSAIRWRAKLLRKRGRADEAAAAKATLAELEVEERRREQALDGAGEGRR